MKLVEVYRGPFPQVLALHASLGADGWETVIPDSTIKTIDPFVTGGAVFDVSLQALEEEAQEIAAAIQTRLESRGQQQDESESTPAAPQALAEEATRAAEAIGRRIQWSVIAFAPLALFCAPRYLALAKRSVPPPPNHGYTLAAIALGVFETIGLAAWVIVLLP